MPRKSNEKIVEDLDHALEVALILINVSFGMLAQFTTNETKEILPPIIANLRRLSIVFVFPTMLVISTWIVTYFLDDDTLKMRLKTYAWSSIIFLAILELIEVYVMSWGPNRPVWSFYPLFIPVFFGLLAPVIPWWLMRKVLKRYRIALEDIGFFTKGKRATLYRWSPFASSWIIFWLAFIGSMLT